MSEAVVPRLSSCFAGFPGAVLHLSPGGRVIESNGRLERELGKPVVGERFSEIIDSDSCGEKWNRALAAASSTGTASTCELILTNGETILEPKSFSVLWDGDASFVCLVEHPSDRRMDTVRQQVTEVNSELASAQRDLIRERERLAQALAETERSNRALDEFAHAISHDLKAPLRSVANYARWIEEDLGDQLTGEPRAHMELLRLQVERMRAMISAVLAYSRSVRTRMPPEVVNTNAIVEEVIALLDPPESVTIEVAPDMPTFTAEAAPLRQVLLNLIGNAVKHSRRPDAHVWVSVRDIGYAFEFAVRDNGPGIPLRAQDRIWMLFHTLRPRTTHDAGDDGTGVGLAIVRQLVALQGGRCGIRRMKNSATTRTILLVEDDPHDRLMVRRLLQGQRRNYVIHEAGTGEDGLRRCRDLRPDCILLDYYLPDMDGREWLEAYHREIGRMTPVPVAMLTGRDDDDIAVAVLEEGAQDYLVKDGATSHGLTRAIENAIEKFRIRREIEEQRAAIELRNHKLEVLRDELQTKLVELADATKAKDRFLAVMSHEMRTPLNAILGYADLLDMELDGALSEGQRQQIERIRFGSRHLLDLINDLLDLARLDARRLDLDVRPVDLGAVVEEVAALLEAQATGKGITLEASPCGDDVPHVLADLQRLRQILTNLVGNAIKFTEKGGITITCEAARRDGLVSIVVRDSGIGISPEALPLVFTEFYQADDELTRRRGGSGLGLAIAQRLAQLMGGHITVDSDLGHGSTFTIFLRPAAAGSVLRPDDIMQHGERMAAHNAPFADRRRPLVSVVAFGQDAKALAELEDRVRGGVRLLWTTNVDEVPRLVARERASLAIVDVGSAGSAAWRAALALQEVPELASTAVLLLPSIPAPTGDETEGLDLGWVSLIPKPFTAEQLTRAVSTAARETAEERTESERPVEVLVVDDDPDSRRVAAKFLAEANVRVREAQDGESALVEMRSHPPDVLVLDLMMPVLDGFGVLATLRADPLLAGIPVVVLTAKSLTEAERQFLSRSAVRVLQKGEHRLADVAALVLRAAMRAGRGSMPNDNQADASERTSTSTSADAATVS